MRVEVRRNKKGELPPFTVVFAFEKFHGIVRAEKVFHEGKEVQEDRDFDNIFKVEIEEEWGLKREDDFFYSPMFYVYLWEDTDVDVDVDDMEEEITSPLEALWRKVEVKAMK
jgi:hypothetical protein